MKAGGRLPGNFQASFILIASGRQGVGSQGYSVTDTAPRAFPFPPELWQAGFPTKVPESEATGGNSSGKWVPGLPDFRANQ